MPDFLKPIAETTLAHDYGLLKSHTYDLRRRNGQWQRQVRETYDSGDGAGVLLCDVADGSVILIRQFRFPAFYRGEAPYILEVCAGKLDGDDPETCARKESIEETGYRIGELRKAYNCFSSPGSVTERLTLFLGMVEGGPAEAGGGLSDEGEDIEVVRLPFATALGLVESGEIHDAKTILLLQYALLQQVFA